MMVFSLDEDLSSLRIDDDYTNNIDPLAQTVINEEDEEFIIDTDNHMAMDSPNGPVSSISMMDYLSTNTGTGIQTSQRNRRRSSVLDKFSVLSPAHTRRVSMSTNTKDNGLDSIGDNLIPDQYPKLTKVDLADTENIVENEKNKRIVDDFKPIRVLGKGAYGKVILVKDQKSRKLYAMKQLKKAEILINEEDLKDDSGDDGSINNEKKNNKNIERTFAERTILSELEHPNIVKLFYSFHDSEKLYLILQYVPGGELFFHLKEHGTLDEDTVSFYAAEISCALKFLHEKGIVYRDLKPENCLLNERGHLMLTDFGLSKKSIDDTTPERAEDVYTLHSIIGTPEYCAPEILQGLPYSKNCDWYSLGCLLFDMLVGKPPYTGNNHKVILNKIQKDKQGPRIPFYLSEGMKDMLNWLLKKDKMKRWDVDKYWAEEKNQSNNRGNSNGGKKKKPGKQRELKYQSHFIFRKINWGQMESGDLQRTSLGPIVPIITDWELAENFDTEFTSMSYEDTFPSVDIPNYTKANDDIFKGFSFKATNSYLERYF